MYQAYFPGLGRGLPPAKFGRVQSQSHLIMYQAYFPGLGRGLRGPITPVFGFAQ